MPGLGTTFGRGGATTAQQDLANADCILICGSSMAEAHPVGFRWVMQAREQGATIIHVDPRYSRTSAVCDMWAPIRSGTDIVFLGGLIRYVLAGNRFFEEYVAHYTNAPLILPENFRDTEDLDGVFSGWDHIGNRYDDSTWRYAWDGERDMSMQHPRCVLSVLRRHFERYTPEMVESVTGMPRPLFERIAETLCRNSGAERTTAICYAVGWTQHSVGVQVIRTAAILQLLLGNIGRPGGGILALRGHASIQGSTDIPTLFDLLPGYLPMPRSSQKTLADYLRDNKKPSGTWSAIESYMVSMLKAWYGEHANADSDRGYRFLPRIDRDHSHFAVVGDMKDQHVQGYFVLGENPAVGSQNSRLQRSALARLKWLVVRDLVMIETATFWLDGPEIETGELRTEDVGTEVFFFPAASHVENDGTYTNTQRLLQWREKAVEPPADARSDDWFLYHLGRRLQQMARASDDPRDAALRALQWEYAEDEPNAEQTLREINGFHVGSDQQLRSAADIRADGSTACGCWIYCGVYPEKNRNRAHEKAAEGLLGHGWGFAWPNDRRILYNRASARPDGSPWSERKKLVWWDGARWTGLDTPDFVVDKAPDYVPPADAEGLAALRGDAPFIMHEDGLGWIFVPYGLKDGPLPTHFEPRESVSPNALYPGRPFNPVANYHERPDNPLARPVDERFPHVLTTYRLTEQHTAGGMSRWLRHLAELQPAMFAELSPQLAAEVGVRHGGWITIVTLRGAIEARALVTRRVPPLCIGGRVVHQVAIPFHFGHRGLVTGDAANDLIPMMADPNSLIHEGKTLTCQVLRGRRPRGKALLEFLRRLGA